MTAPTRAPARIADYACLVTGAASGIGRAVTELLRAEGATVVGADLPAAGWGPDRGVPVDLADPASVAEAVAAAERATGGLHAVVNCAGVLGPVQPAHQETVAEFERLLAVNLTGAFALSRSVLPAMAARGFGRLVHLSSTAGKEGSPQLTGYSASKAGVIGLVKALAREYAPTGVTVNAVAPGSIDTPLLHRMSDERRAAVKALIPVGRFGQPAEVAALIRYILSPEAAFTTGFVYDLSGGRATY